MIRFQTGLTVAVVSLALGVVALGVQTAGDSPGAGRPTSITPGNSSGSVPPGTMSDNAGITGLGITGLGITGLGITGLTLPGMMTSTPLQRGQDNTTSASAPAVAASNANQKTAAAPVKSANSFIMGEARRRIEPGGFS